jgi:hypothetical protein
MATSSAFAAQFPEAQFRQSIRDAMKMGMPEDDAEKLTWFWKRAQTFNPDDLAGRPLDWTAAPITDDPGNPVDDAEDDGMIVDYALEANNLSSQVDQSITALGNFNFQKIKVTLFDVDFEKIRTADYARIGTIVYTIRLEAPPYALFGVTMHDVHLEALDEI